MCCIGKWPHCSSLQNRFLVMNLAIAQNQKELLTRTMKNSLNYNVSLPNLSTTTITAMGCCQCLSLSVVQLKSKHCQKNQLPPWGSGYVQASTGWIFAKLSNGPFWQMTNLWLCLCFLINLVAWLRVLRLCCASLWCWHVNTLGRLKRKQIVLL